MNETRNKIGTVHRYERGSVEESLNVFLDGDDSCYKTPPSENLDSFIVESQKNQKNIKIYYKDSSEEPPKNAQYKNIYDIIKVEELK